MIWFIFKFVLNLEIEKDFKKNYPSSFSAQNPAWPAGGPAEPSPSSLSFLLPGLLRGPVSSAQLHRVAHSRVCSPRGPSRALPQPASALPAARAVSPFSRCATGPASQLAPLVSARPHAFSSPSLHCRPHPSAAPSFFPALLPFCPPPMAHARLEGHRAGALIWKATESNRVPRSLPCTPQPPAYKAEPHPSFSPFSVRRTKLTTTAVVPLLRCRINDAEAPVSFSVTRRIRR